MKRRAWFAQLKPLLWLTIVTSAFLTEQSTYTLNILVTSESDAGPGTLRQAILDINSGTSDENTIIFAPNVHTITLTNLLPPVEQPTTIDGFGMGIDCTQLSPVSAPEEFSAAITVTIDGSQVVSAGTELAIGFLIEANDVIVRGLRIANFTNGDDTAVWGILTNEGNTLIECCEITGISGNSNVSTVVGIEGEDSTIISRCFVHNIYSANIQASNTATSTGLVRGISSFKQVTESRVENLKSGDIVHNAFGINPTLVSGATTGITNVPIPKTRLCECPINCLGLECVLMQNCIVNCCQSGSITATQDAEVTIGSCSGILIEQFMANSENRVDGCSICNISTGTAHLSDGTFLLVVENVFGINASSEITCLSNNTISKIHRGLVEIGGLNSLALLGVTVGIFSGLGTIVAENNIISHVKCQPVTASGICTTIIDESSAIERPLCVNSLLNPIEFAIPICAGIWLQSETTQMCNNTITFIDVGKRSTNGEQSLIRSGYAAGIFTNTRTSVTAHNNTVQDIFGAKLLSGPTTRGLFGGIGSKGIIFASLGFDIAPIIDAQGNIIERICEQTLRTSPGTIGRYAFIENLSSHTEALLPAAQTIGLSVVLDAGSQIPLDFTLGAITIENNTINHITGAIVHGTTHNIGTMAVGIGIIPLTGVIGSDFDNVGVDLQQFCLDLQGTTTTPLIRGNTIHTIRGGTNNTAYGILVDGSNIAVKSLAQFSTVLPLLFCIENNTINNIVGHGIPQPFNSTIVPDSCGTQENTPITLVPFPYQPAAGIYTIFNNCSTIESNTINNVTETGGNARGITTQASSDVDIFDNTISGINGNGIFVGGATASLLFVNNVFGLFTEAEFEAFFASTRNKIYSNSTFDTTQQVIELGLINWNDYFNVSHLECGSSNFFFKTHQDIADDTTAVFGNHGQVAPRILMLKCNRDGTVTIDFTLDSPSQPFTKFVIQFFVNKNNSVPHGEQHINEFDDPRFIFQTDVHGHALRSITFTPLTSIQKNDTISAHVTVTSIGQSTSVENKYKGDTSEFGTKSNAKPCPPTIINTHSHSNNTKPGFASILGV